MKRAGGGGSDRWRYTETNVSRSYHSSSVKTTLPASPSPAASSAARSAVSGSPGNFFDAAARSVRTASAISRACISSPPSSRLSSPPRPPRWTQQKTRRSTQSSPKPEAHRRSPNPPHAPNSRRPARSTGSVSRASASTSPSRASRRAGAGVRAKSLVVRRGVRRGGANGARVSAPLAPRAPVVCRGREVFFLATVSSVSSPRAPRARARSRGRDARCAPPRPPRAWTRGATARAAPPPRRRRRRPPPPRRRSPPRRRRRRARKVFPYLRYLESRRMFPFPPSIGRRSPRTPPRRRRA